MANITVRAKILVGAINELHMTFKKKELDRSARKAIRQAASVIEKELYNKGYLVVWSDLDGKFVCKEVKRA